MNIAVSSSYAYFYTISIFLHKYSFEMYLKNMCVQKWILRSVAAMHIFYTNLHFSTQISFFLHNCLFIQNSRLFVLQKW